MNMNLKIFDECAIKSGDFNTSNVPRIDKFGITRRDSYSPPPPPVPRPSHAISMCVDDRHTQKAGCGCRAAAIDSASAISTQNLNLLFLPKSSLIKRRGRGGAQYAPEWRGQSFTGATARAWLGSL